MKRYISLLSIMLVGTLSAVRQVDEFLGEKQVFPKELASGPVKDIDTKGIVFKAFDEKEGIATLDVSRERKVQPVSFKVKGSKLLGRSKIKAEGEKQLVVRYMNSKGELLQVVAPADTEVEIADAVHVISAYVGIPGVEKAAQNVSRGIIKAFYNEQRKSKKGGKKPGMFGAFGKKAGHHKGKKGGKLNKEDIADATKDAIDNATKAIKEKRESRVKAIKKSVDEAVEIVKEDAPEEAEEEVEDDAEDND